MTYAELKKSPVFAQLTVDEKRLVRNHLGTDDPQKAWRVRVVLERAEKKAQVQAQLQNKRAPESGQQ